MQLSIIIPVFKVKEFIRQCLVSALAIRDLSYEVIIVQDVHVDDSLEDVSELLSDPRIRILDRKNAGLSVARNEGLQVANGEYVYFMDSDDYIDPSAFSDLFICYYRQTPDILIGTFKYIGERGEYLCDENKKLSFNAQGIFIGKDYLPRHYSLPMAWLNIYRRAFLEENHLSFKSGIYFEDVEFSPRVLYLASKVCVTTRPFYYYRIRSRSLQRQDFGDKKLGDSFAVACSLLEFSDHRVEEKSLRDYFSKRALAICFGVLGFFVQDHTLSKEQAKKLDYVLRRVSILTPLPIHFRIMLLIHRMTMRGMLYLVKKRYKQKYF